LELTWRICGEVDIPVLVDLGYGWGGSEQAAYWTREFERAGAAALHVDDKECQRCPFLPGPPVPRIPRDKFIGKLHAMMDARKENMMILVREGSFGSEREEAIDRLQTYKKEGADVLLVSGRDREEMKYLRKELEGPLALQARPVPSVTGWGEETGDLASTAGFDELYELGWQIFNFWGGFSVAYRAMLDAMTDIRKARSIEVIQERLLDWDILQELVGYPRAETSSVQAPGDGFLNT
jgi:2-methylisocitrate lyase-like PEP mutase family enzyme